MQPEAPDRFGLPAAPVHPAPMPTGWDFALLPTAEGQPPIVLVRISLPTGTTYAFGTPVEMLDIAQKLMDTAKQGVTGIITLPKDLILPPGVNGHDHRPPGQRN